MQSIQGRDDLIHDRTAISNHIRSLLLEFGIVIPKGLAYLRQRVPLALEDAENGLPMAYRPTLHRMFLRFRAIEEDLAFLDQEVDTIVNIARSPRSMGRGVEKGIRDNTRLHLLQRENAELKAKLKKRGNSQQNAEYGQTRNMISPIIYGYSKNYDEFDWLCKVA